MPEPHVNQMEVFYWATLDCVWAGFCFVPGESCPVVRAYLFVSGVDRLGTGSESSSVASVSAEGSFCLYLVESVSVLNSTRLVEHKLRVPTVNTYQTINYIRVPFWATNFADDGA